MSGKGDPDADQSGADQSGADQSGVDSGPVAIPLLGSWVAVSALSRDTTTIRLGHLVNAVGYRPPALLGRMAATLDVISGGRLEF
ncbi:MAG: LLM class flavin-dependent oxidoreductase, partial [Nitrospinota bacterium]|nr:LLM class flavin-dependent oxidoreductase [Nitrospinota bacterium]